MTRTGTNRSEPLANQMLSLAVLNALEIAASRRDGRALGTLDILLGAIAVDETGVWDSVQLRATFLTENDLTRFEDPDAAPGGTWHNVQLTETATMALGRAARFADEYQLRPLPPGGLALGLLSEPSSAASRALLEESTLTHAQLIDLIQDEVLGTRLDDLNLTDGPPSPPGRIARIGELLQPREDRAAPESLSEVGPDQPLSGPALIDRVMKRAQAIEATADPGSFSLLLASIEASHDPELVDLLESMLLDPVELGAMRTDLASHEDTPATDAIQRAIERFDDDLDTAALIATIALQASPRVSAALGARALSGPEVAAQLSEWRSPHLREKVGVRVFTVSILTMLASLATTILLVLSIAESGNWWEWWKLSLLLLVWWGYPKEGPAAGIAVALVLALLTRPIVGVAQAVGVLSELAQAQVERDAVWARTGVRLSLREQRHVAVRALNASGRRMRMYRQAVTIALRSPRS